MSKDKKKQEVIAVFRYGLIAPALHMNRAQTREYFRELSGNDLDVPFLGRKSYKISTFKDWLSKYRIGGLDSLKPAIRWDKGITRSIPEDVIEVVEQTIKDLPFLSGTGIYRMLINQGYIREGDFAAGTLREHIRKRHLREDYRTKKERKKFEKENINELWTADFMHGPYLKEGKKKRQIYLCGIIDDHSRMLVGWGWYVNENSIALTKTLKSAISTYGIPKVFYCDNGKVFHTNYLQLIAAKMGIALVHSKPYDSPSRGKIERFFRTVRGKFLAALDPSKLSLNELTDLFADWIDKQYHKHFHEGIHARPLDRYLDNVSKNNIKTISSHELDNIFMNDIHRIVKNDATISINSILYEVPANYIGKKVKLCFPIDQPDKITLMDDNSQPVCLIKEVNLYENANKPHTGIHFRNIEQEDNNDDD